MGYSMEIDDPPPLQDRQPLATDSEHVDFSHFAFLLSLIVLLYPFLFIASAANSRDQRGFGRLK